MTAVEVSTVDARGKVMRSLFIRGLVTVLLLASTLLFPAIVAAQGAAATEVDDRGDEPGHYEFRGYSREGTGKFYMGREISHVMGHRGAAWLDRPEREREQRTDRLIEQLPLEANSVVADIGAGTGYFSFRIAERLPEVKVLAVDIQQEMLDIIESRKASGLAAQVETVLGSERDPRLPAGSVDLILLVDAYHEFSWPREMGEAMVRALKPGGQLVLVEYRGEDPSVPIKRLHKMTEKQARAEMDAVGLVWESTGAFLPQQHFMVFRK